MTITATGLTEGGAAAAAAGAGSIVVAVQIKHPADRHLRRQLDTELAYAGY